MINKLAIIGGSGLYDVEEFEDRELIDLKTPWGKPSDKILKEGDIVNVDVTAYKDGWHGDTSRMFSVGDVSIKAKKLINITYESMMKAIKILRENIFLGDIGSTIQNYVESNGFSVVRDFCGHGVGKDFHQEPNILHYGQKGTGKKIKRGDTIMIVEAMKTMNHVPSTMDGVVKEILVSDGQPVEFGQTLIVLE